VILWTTVWKRGLLAAWYGAEEPSIGPYTCIAPEPVPLFHIHWMPLLSLARNIGRGCSYHQRHGDIRAVRNKRVVGIEAREKTRAVGDSLSS